jgi:predicted CXXCH cytochrome family protein
MRPVRSGFVAFLPLLLCGLLSLGAKPLHPYRTQGSLDSLLALGPHAGDCDQCHTMHGQTSVVYGHALLGPDENTLCDRCHDTPWAGGSYAGTTAYLGSAHAAGNGTVWPGPDPPARTEAGAAGKCLNCHDPHGLPDNVGIIPMLTIGREESLCLACHDGAPASTNIGADLAKPFTHPVTLYSGRHAGPLESLPTDFAAAPTNNRHSECVDCHDPHVATADPAGIPPAPGLARANLGVSRVLVQNGAAGARPAFTLVAGSDTLSAPVAEYQLCFKCHSSWTTQPTGQTDLALELNPANASYHPVESIGRDLSIQGGAFVPGWGPTSLTRCGDCHGSDFTGAPRGPHGSANRYILKQPYTASSQARPMGQDENCFSCHSYDVYANPNAPDVILGQSRFNKPGVAAGHAEHVGQQNVPCYACHVTHGAPSQPHLLVTGRMPGLQAYTETAGGGTCQPTCHDSRSYSTNYAR